jgi:hypothetical protein
MGRWPILRAHAGGALLSAAAAARVAARIVVRPGCGCPACPGGPPSAPPPVQLEGGRWLVWPVAGDGHQRWRWRCEGTSAGVGGADELELLELLMWP